MTDMPPDRLTLDRLLLDRLDTPVGTALIVSDEAGVLRAFNWTDYEAPLMTWLARAYPAARLQTGRSPATAAFAAYFAGDPAALTDQPWRAVGTAFQREVWAALCSIGPGQTLSYAGLAARIGRPTAVRAVGLANGANPVAVAVPCHRVIGASGLLTGYGGGLSRKRWLLQHEGAVFREARAA